MIIKALTIENFKGIREPVRVEFKTITLLFGPNSAGKSTIVQAMHYAREILERHNLDADITQQGGDYVDLGGFRNLIFDHDETRSVKLSFELELGTRYELPDYIEIDTILDFDSDIHDSIIDFPADKIKSVAVNFDISWSSFFEKPYVSAYETGVNGEFFARITSNSDGKWINISKINFAHPLFITIQKEASDDPELSLLRLYKDIVKREIAPTINDVDLKLVGCQDALPPIDSPLSFFKEDFYEEKDVAAYGSLHKMFTAYMSRLLIGPAAVLRDALRTFRYLGPIRETPPRNYESPRFHEHARWSNGLAAWDVLNTADERLISEISKWMNDRLKTGYTLTIKNTKELEVGSPLYNSLVSGTVLDDYDNIAAEIKRLPLTRHIRLIDEKRSLQVMPQDVGIGISQVLPVVVAALSGTGNIIGIEQPELHIHPALQAELADIFIQSAVADKKNTFIIETHSEHLILRIMRRMRETASDNIPQDGFKVTSNDVAVLFVEPDGARSIVREMPLNEKGELVKAWPGGFFEEGLREVF